MIITQVLQNLFPEKRISTSPKNFNSELGLVFSVFEITEYTPNFSSLLKNIFIILKKMIF
jgi:UDP-N-acetylmuramyl pentapeptide synthase